MAYYFIRILIHRPVVSFAQPNEASASVLALSDSSKHTIQIIELIDERRMSLSFGINRKELIFLSGLGLLWQNMGLKRDCKLAKESQRLLSTVLDLLEAELAPAAAEFSKIANLLTPVKGNQAKGQEMLAPTPQAKPPKKQSSQSLKSRESGNSRKERPSQLKVDERSRKTTIANTSPISSEHSVRSSSQSSGSSAHVERAAPAAPLTGKPSSAVDLRLDYLNLDYLPFGDGNDHCQATDSPMSKPGLTMEDWEHVLGDLDNGRLNIFNGIYGGSGCGDDSNTLSSLTGTYPMQQQQQQQQQQQTQLHQQRSQSTHSIPAPLNDLQDWYPDDSWSSPLHHNDLRHHLPSHGGLSSASTQSVLSYSDGGGSVEDLTLPAHNHSHSHRSNMRHSHHLGTTNRDDGLSIDPYAETMMGLPGSAVTSAAAATSLGLNAGVQRDQYGFVEGWR